jgi:hypothetical protein
VSDGSRVRSTTDEDLERIFGRERLLIGFPVRPTGGTPPEQPSPQDAAEPGESSE